MLPLMAGRVGDYTRLAVMENKWQQRKKEITKTLKEKYGSSEKLNDVMQRLHYQEELEQIRERSRQSELYGKIQSGAALTPDEIEYLKQKNPKAYQAYKEAKMEEKAYEKQLESCDTKEDVEKLENVKMGEFLSQVKEVADNPKIPKGEKLALIEKIHAKAERVRKVHDHFVQSLAYASLPTEEEKEEAEKRKSRDEVQGVCDDIVIEKQKQSGSGIVYMDLEGNQVTKEDSVQENVTGSLERVTYDDVAEAVKDYAAEYRETGAGLGMLLSIERIGREKNEPGAFSE